MCVSICMTFFLSSFLPFLPFNRFLGREMKAMMQTIIINSKRTGNYSLMTTTQIISGFTPAKPQWCMNCCIHFRIELVTIHPVPGIARGSNRWTATQVRTTSCLQCLFNICIFLLWLLSSPCSNTRQNHLLNLAPKAETPMNKIPSDPRNGQNRSRMGPSPLTGVSYTVPTHSWWSTLHNILFI